MTTTYALLFDEADLATLAGGRMYVEWKGAKPAGPVEWTEVAQDAPAWNGYPDPDIASRIIHDRQFMDLSERYDPVEPSDDDLADAADRDRLFIILGTCAVIFMQACFVGYALASLIW